MPLLKKLLMGSGIVATGVGAWVASRPKPAPFHVDNVPPVVMKVGGINLFPAISFVMRNLPDEKRRIFMAKMGAPKPNEVRDTYDCKGESPYTVTELVPDRLWRVKYDFIMASLLTPEGKQQAKALGTDPAHPDYAPKVLAGARSYGEKAEQVAHQDIEKAVDLFSRDSISESEQFDLIPWEINSFVVKLNSGSLLLYAPVRIRDDFGFADWLNSLGKVEWVVIASGAHTLNIEPVVKRYPSAKVIGPPQAEAKLNVISALPRGKVDFDSTNPEALAAVNAALDAEGVKLFDIAGDVVTNAVVAIFDHRHLMSCDLLYSMADGGFLMIDKERFEKFLPEDWFMRIFRYVTTAKPNSPSGYLPAYRYQLMDLNSLGAMMYDHPAWDGSSCDKMAGALRQVIKADFEYANGVHFNQLDKEAYVDGLNKNWNWLDGKSLL